MKNTLIGWVTFWGGFGIEMLVDYLLRKSGGTMDRGGIPENIWYMIEVFLLVPALYFLYEGVRNFNSALARIATVFLQVSVWFVLLIFTSLTYVCSAGIDCM